MKKIIDNSDFHLTHWDKVYLVLIGYKLNDFKNIENAVKETNGIKFYKKNGAEVKWNTAKKNLGRNMFLSGIGRSTYHKTAYRDNGIYSIDFDYINW